MLENENDERKDIERRLVEEAVGQADSMIGQGAGGLALWLEHGHPGVHGIVASRIVERYGHPVVCLSPQRGSESQVAGSARSIDGLHVLEVLRTIDRRHPGLFVKFGGHAMAAGLTLSRDDVSEFQAAFSVAVGQQLDGHALSPELWSDGDIDPPEITDELLSAFDEMEPWGRGFESPVFESEFTVLRARAVGEDPTHLSRKGGGRAFGGI